MKIRRKNGNNWGKKNEDGSENENEMGSMRIGRIRRERVRRKRARRKKKELEEGEGTKVEVKQKVRLVEVSM